MTDPLSTSLSAHTWMGKESKINSITYNLLRFQADMPKSDSIRPPKKVGWGAGENQFLRPRNQRQTRRPILG